MFHFDPLWLRCYFSFLEYHQAVVFDFALPDLNFLESINLGLFQYAQIGARNDGIAHHLQG